MTENALLGTSLAEIGPASFTRLVERLLHHLGFTEVSNIDGAGDGGADLLALRDGVRWVFQVKSKRSGNVDETGVEDLIRGVQNYEAHRGAVVTNTGFTTGARKRADQLSRATKVELGLWGREQLMLLSGDPDRCMERFSPPDLRTYQIDAFQAARADLQKTGRAFLVLATGLGKTVIAGTLIDWFLDRHPNSRVLVLAHTRDLVNQLERSLWQHLPKGTPTQQLQGDERPETLHGVTVATVQTAVDYVRQGFRPDLIFIDEAHHAGEGGMYSEVLGLCPEALHIGATATPWRGDEFDVANHFGEPSCSIGIEEGMRLGYLVDVVYRLFVDNIDWDYVRTLSSRDYSIKELNRRLFLPQRDEKIRDELLEVWLHTSQPRGIVFCQTIEHAEKMVQTLRGVPHWRNIAAIHNDMTRREQTTRLARFRLGDIPILVSVDILNEGVDVPDVNVVCFARVTHSRRIFIQQLGRGLRISPGKSHVTVLDFVSDLRRARAAFALRSAVSSGSEELVLPSSHSITFNDAQAESFLSEWIFDAASLDTEADQVHLDFPPTP